MTRISDMTQLTTLPVAGAFVPVEKTGVASNYRIDLGALTTITPQMFAEQCGLTTLGLGTQDDSPAFVAAIAYLKTFALNTGGSGFYKGSPELFIPAGHYYLGTTTLDINHTVRITGEGSGELGPQAFGCTQLRWAAGTNGIRVQAATTEGNTTVSGATHDGSGGVVLSDMCLEGGFAGTEGEYHGLVIRNAIKGTNLYIKNWPGEGVKAWAGTVTGFGAVAGNCSTTRLIGVKCEDNRGGFDIRGSDSNVITLINCEAVDNRQFGYLDDNGAGSNTIIGMHCASNGQFTGTWPQTQCSYSGNRYAAKWGGDPTVAPSGGTTDTANWLYIEAGGAIANTIPAWVNTPNTFRAGGDYLTLENCNAHFLGCYSEGGGFSQFSPGTVIDNGTIAVQYSRGGVRLRPVPDGYELRLNSAAGGNMWLCTGIGEIGVWARDLDGTTFGYLDFVKTGDAYVNGATGVTFRHAGTLAGRITTTGFVAAGTVTGSNLSGTNTGDQTITLTGDVTGTGTGSFATTLGTVAGAVKSSSATAGVGYATGAGAAVTQLTSKSTATPAINKVCGQVTMNNAALGAGAKVSFVVTNSTVAATDTIIVSVASGGTANAYRAAVTAISAGVSFTVTVENITAGSLSEAPVINFAIIKAVAA